MLQMSRPSDTRSPILRRGFRDEIGSWKIICIRGRFFRSASPLSLVRSSPSNTTLPDVGGGSWIIARAVVDLPHPDSPTRPNVSPSRMSRLTSETAWTFRPDRPTGNSTTRCSACRSVSSAARRWAVPLPATSGDPGLARRRRRRRRSALTVGADGGRHAGGPVARQRVLTLGCAHREPARELVAGHVALAQWRLLLDALVLRVRAPGREATADGRVHELRRTARDDVQPGVALVGELRDRAHERLGV